jgi:uncharacterized membrane protein YcaP (DUF421 family)
VIWTLVNAALLFGALLVVLRVTGKRELAQMSPFDLVMLYVIGDVTAEAVVGEDTSFIGAMAIVSVLALLTVLVSWISYRFPRSRPTLDGVPCIVVRDGVPDRTVMRREHLTVDDVDEAARSQGIRDLADIELAILEPSGHFSFFTRSG